MSIPELLNQTIALHDAFARTKNRYASRFAPDFNFCDFIEIDELRISRLIAWLLDPASNHGQGDAFLKLFLLRLQLDWPDATTARSRVIVEAPAHGQRRRRIDILIKCGGRAIGVENKLKGAVDQDDQVKDYLLHLDSEAPNDPHRCLIYLTITGTEPTKESIDVDHLKENVHLRRLRLWSFEYDIREWLLACKAASQASRISHFIDELLQKLSKELEGIRDMSENSEIVAAVVRSPPHVRAAFDVAKASKDIREKLVEMLLSSLIEECAKYEWKVSSDLSPAKERGISIDFGSPSGEFRIQFEGANFAYLIYGLVARVKQIKADNDLRAYISERIGASQIGSGDWWHWFHKADRTDPVFPVESHWDAAAEPWVRIADGSLARDIMSAAKKFKLILDGR